jgi:3-oxoacyl-[acyl-carrier protein] reductase
MSSLDSFKLKGKAALVTGAAAGLGRSIALALADAGAHVGIHYHTSDREAADTLAEVRRRGAEGLILQADLAREEEANALVDRFAEAAGRLDILINNAGALVAKKRIEECPLEVWEKTFALNVTSAFLVTRRAIPHLRRTGSGRIVNIVSASMESGGTFGAGAYAAAKGALHIFTRTMAKEYGPEIRTNSICPGVIETRHHESTPAERLEAYRKATPLARNGAPDEVALAVLYLVSDASSFTNGALLDVNGGRVVR